MHDEGRDADRDKLLDAYDKISEQQREIDLLKEQNAELEQRANRADKAVEVNLSTIAGLRAVEDRVRALTVTYPHEIDAGRVRAALDGTNEGEK